MLLTEQDKQKALIAKLVEKNNGQRAALIPILQAVQNNFGHVSEYAMQVIADLLDIHATEVFSVATFYHFINTKPKGKFVVRVSSDMASIMKGAKTIVRQIENDLGIKVGETTPDGMFTLEWTSCIGMNDLAPAMMVNDEIFTNLTPERANQIIRNCTEEFRSHRRPISHIGETATNTLTYASYSANTALKKALGMGRADVIAEVTASGIRGRGGAGFPTGMKWNFAATAKGDLKYVVCNADEGEPGTFKDRVILAKFADMVFEGMTIAAYAAGASQGVLYLRYEYTYMRDALEKVLEARRAANLLGQNILGKDGFNFDIRIQMGGGAYVCGEETALIESLEGQRGEPRNRPPYPVNTGLNNAPTIVNNVETLASVCCIIDKGGAWFASMGSEKSKGFKLFSISGDCAKPGVYEMPWGKTIAEMLDMVGGSGAKAVQVGGYSGQLIPSSEFGRKLAYEDVATGGSVIIYGPERDMLEVAENYLEFFVEESCGQCTPCRDGNVVLLDGVRRLKNGTCSTHYLNELVSLCDTMQIASKCGLGQASPNVLVALNKHFRDEILGREANA